MESEATALVEMEVCKSEIGTYQQALKWETENGWLPEKIKASKKYLYCHPVYVSDLETIPAGQIVMEGTRVINRERPCPQDGCLNLYLNQQGVVKGIFKDYDSACTAQAETEPITEFWLLSHYQ